MEIYGSVDVYVYVYVYVYVCAYVYVYMHVYFSTICPHRNEGLHGVFGHGRCPVVPGDVRRR